MFTTKHSKCSHLGTLRAWICARQEIDREAPKGEVTAEHLVRMPYVEACIKEALRVYPPAVILGRQLGEATEIKNHIFPKGTGVMVLPLSATALLILSDDSAHAKHLAFL